MIHPTAVIERGAELGPGVEVGPYAVVGASVRVGERTTVGSHAVLQGRTRIGRENRIAPFTAIGGPPQDRAYRGEETRVVIGDRNEIREFVTVHRGSATGRGETRIGCGCLLMAYAHVAHDCEIGDDVTLANGVQLGGHVAVEDGAFLGGLAAVHQNARIGRLAMVAAGSMVSLDVPPYAIVAGDRARIAGLNRVGLQRAGVSRALRATIRRVFATLFLEGRRHGDAVARLEPAPAPEVAAMIEFARASERGVCGPR